MSVDIARVVATVKANNDAYSRVVAELRRLAAENAELRKALADTSASDAVEQILQHLGNVTTQIETEIGALASPEPAPAAASAAG
jgi:ribosomal protein L20